MKGLEEDSEPALRNRPGRSRSSSGASPPSTLSIVLTLASVLVSGVVGMSSAYLTANATFATLSVRVERNERDIDQVERDNKKTSDAIPRLEGKVDALLLMMKDK